MNTNTASTDDARMLGLKTRIAMLWLFQVVNYTSYIWIYEFESLVSFLDSESLESGLTLAIFYFIPCLLIWITYAAKAKLSRWFNIVFASLFALLKVVATLSAAMGSIARPNGDVSLPLIFNEFWAIPAAALIVWYAWRHLVD